MFFLRSLARPITSQTNFTARQSVRLAGGQSQRWQMKFNNAPRTAQYSSAGGLSKEEVEARVLDVFKGFEKVNPNKRHLGWLEAADELSKFLQLTPAARFKEDLALDSLDAVEVVMAVEEEFSIEIPDAEADEIISVQQAINYILESPEAQ